MVLSYSVIFSNIMNTTEYLYGTEIKRTMIHLPILFVMNKMKEDGITTFNFEGVNILIGEILNFHSVVL